MPAKLKSISARCLRPPKRKEQRDVGKFERLAAGLWQRDTTPQEEAAILQAQHEARAELTAKRFKPPTNTPL